MTGSILEGLSTLDRIDGLCRPSGAWYRPTKGHEQSQQAQIPLLFDSSVDWLIGEHLQGTSGIADHTLTSGYAFQVSWFEVAEIAECGLARPNMHSGLRHGVLYGTERWTSPRALIQEAFTVGYTGLFYHFCDLAPWEQVGG